MFFDSPHGEHLSVKNGTKNDIHLAVIIIIVVLVVGSFCCFVSVCRDRERRADNDGMLGSLTLLLVVAFYNCVRFAARVVMSLS